MSIHTAYRPESLEDFLGNEDTVESLQTVLSQKDKSKIPHAFLFVGPKGCGKTTLGRITARMLGCNMETDFIEIDSADDRGVETIRGIRRNANLKPIGGGCRVWFLDEAHMLTREAQSALLKSLEHPPKHVYFILATTDPQILLDTVKDRCTPFEVSQLSEKKMIGLLRKVAKQEGKRIPQDVLELITRESLCTPRTALVLLGKIMNMKEDKMAAAVQKAAEKESQVIQLCRALMKQKIKWKEVVEVLRTVNGDPEQLRRAVLGYCNAIALKEDNARAIYIIKVFKDSIFYCGKPCITSMCYEIFMDFS
jgi:DNA polymerase-3 subunit gamma/tau